MDYKFMITISILSEDENFKSINIISSMATMHYFVGGEFYII